ncbi:MAG: T9SS type A sorting domain-containing protein [Candidatus Cloacimonadota bacterium]|nr:T9SS type A sorting domain-containing protein [Candidatus Cloacimonadota bacterium]
MNSIMKIILAIISFIVILTKLNSETIIDSVYSVPELDGYLIFSTEGTPVYMNWGSYEMRAGDTGPSSIQPSPPSNSTIRAFLSFGLPEIPVGYAIDSVYVRLYQFDSLGGYPTQWFPIWNVTGGDTIKCILSHINYGSELDWGDWSKGDICNPDTFTNYVGIVSESEEDGYRFIDVTDCVIYDYQEGRPLSQYRISFQLDTDLDDHPDYIAFGTSDATVNYGKPQIVLYLSESNSIDTATNELNDNDFIIYPNPISENTKGITINFVNKNGKEVVVEIYNLKGQKVKSIKSKFKEQIVWNGKDSNDNTVNTGIYFYKIVSENSIAFGKITIIR